MAKYREAPIDRLSNLPIELQFKILSYLPMTQAVATSILSNTWRSLCLDRPSLHFHYNGIDSPDIRTSQFPPQSFSFSAFFDDFSSLVSPRLLISSRDIQLKSRPFYYLRDIVRLVEIAIRNRVEIFDVAVPCGVSLPSSVLTCSTIAVLRLDGVVLNDSDCVSVCLPSLKILHLNFVTFQLLENIERLLHCSMTNLEDLVMNNVTCSSFEDEDAQVLVQRCKSFPKLIRANINSALSISLDRIPNVESLQIRTRSYYHCYHQAFDSPTFHNLISMEVKFYDTCWGLVNTMLQYTPNLQNLVISKELGGTFIPWRNPKHDPECVSSHLRTCYIEGFDSEDWKLACVVPFAKYVVGKGSVLETMTISCIYPFVKNLINKEVQSWARSSPLCQVNIVASRSIS